MMKKVLSLLFAMIMVLGVLSLNNSNNQLKAEDTQTSDYVVSFRKRDRLNNVGHYATGWLYGLSENNVPSLESIETLKPKILASKNKDGLQHPTGDVWRVADTFFSAGGEQIQVYLQDFYPDFPYNKNIKPSMNDYIEQAVLPTIRAVKQHEYADKWAFSLFNESDWIWFDHDGSAANLNSFLAAWLEVYNAVKAEWNEAVIVGPGFAYYDEDGMEGFIKFCIDNNCMPDVFSWHELENSTFDNSWYNHIALFHNLEQKYKFKAGRIAVNEYAEAQQCSVPGELVKYISGFESESVYACLPYWNIANNLNDLMAEYNCPNAAWWLYKWYADMEGVVLNSYATNTTKDGLKGLTAYDEENKRTISIFGGTSNEVNVVYNNLNESIYNEYDKIHVTVETAHWSGYDGIQDYTPIIFDQDVEVINNSINIPLTNLNKMDAYKVIITKATQTPADILYSKIIEAESDEVTRVNANCLSRSGINSSWEHFAMSYSGVGVTDGSVYAGVTMYQSTSTLEFEIDVSKDSLYKIDFIYGTSTRNFYSQNLYLNGTFIDEISYDPTINVSRLGKKSVFLNLTSGKNTIKLSNNALTKILIDRVDVYEMPKSYDNTKPIITASAKSADFYKTALKEGASVSGFGKIDAYARFTIIVPCSGLYALNLNTQKAQEEIKFGVEINHITVGAFTLIEDQKSCSDTVFLEKGINIIDINADNDVLLDNITAQYLNDGLTNSYEFENGNLGGNVNVVNSSYASNGKYVNIGGGKDNFVTLNVTVPKSGSYRLLIDYSSNDAKGTHMYNIDTIDPYVQLEINGGTPKTYYFRSSYHWDRYITLVIDITLNQGENTLKFYNDNVYQYNGILDTDAPTPRLDRLHLIKNADTQSITYMTDKKDSGKKFNIWYVLAPVLGVLGLGGIITAIVLIKKSKK